MEMAFFVSALEDPNLFLFSKGIIYDKTQKLFYPFLFTTLFYVLAFLFTLAVTIINKAELIRHKFNSIRGRRSFEPTTQTL